MCGRYAVFLEEENQEMREIINAINTRYKDDAHKMKTGEIFPTNTAAAITADTENKRVANLFKWGFPSFKHPGNVLINARSETLEEKPTFKRILHSNRCLIPASGFYEWKSIDGKKEKYLIRSAENSLIYMAGLYNNFTDNAGIPYTAFVIITTDANAQMAEIHSRMPLILSPSFAASWINKTDNIQEISGLLKAYSGQLSFER